MIFFLLVLLKWFIFIKFNNWRVLSIIFNGVLNLWDKFVKNLVLSLLYFVVLFNNLFCFIILFFRFLDFLCLEIFFIIFKIYDFFLYLIGLEYILIVIILLLDCISFFLIKGIEMLVVMIFLNLLDIILW